MIRKAFAILATVAAVGAFCLVRPAPASADTENCVSHAEYDQTDVFMSVAHIAAIYDVPGSYYDTDSPDTFGRTYRSLCWTDSQAIRIIFDQDSGLSIRWRLIDQ